MKFVLELSDKPLIYLCDKCRLPNECYYFDTKNDVIVGKFSSVLVEMGNTSYDEEFIISNSLNVHYSGNISEAMEDIARNLDLWEYDTSYISKSGLTIDEWTTFLYRHTEQLKAVTAKILDFYIQHRPTTMKSAKKEELKFIQV